MTTIPSFASSRGVAARADVTIRAAIVDDEGPSRRRIRELLASERGIVVDGEYGRIANAIAGLSASPVDLVFLDVEMPRLNGFELLGRLSPRPAAIFITAHPSYARMAFDVSAVDYLLKPFDDDRFRQAIDRARSQLALVTPSELRPSSAAFTQRLVVKRGGTLVFLRMEEVDWIETAGNDMRVHAGGSSYVMRGALARLEETLDPHRFARINRSMVVNLDRITQLRPTGEQTFVADLRSGEQLEVLAKYRRAIQAAVF